FTHHPAPPRIPPLSLHDALPILEERAPLRIRPLVGVCPEAVALGLEEVGRQSLGAVPVVESQRSRRGRDRHAGADRASQRAPPPDRKSTRLNSSHVKISYAVFCL